MAAGLATGLPVTEALLPDIYPNACCRLHCRSAHRTSASPPPARAFCQEEKALKEMKSATTHYRVLAIGKDKARPLGPPPNVLAPCRPPPPPPSKHRRLTFRLPPVCTVLFPRRRPPGDPAVVRPGLVHTARDRLALRGQRPRGPARSAHGRRLRRRGLRGAAGRHRPSTRCTCPRHMGRSPPSSRASPW